MSARATSKELNLRCVSYDPNTTISQRWNLAYLWRRLLSLVVAFTNTCRTSHEHQGPAQMLDKTCREFVLGFTPRAPEGAFIV